MKRQAARKVKGGPRGEPKLEISAAEQMADALAIHFRLKAPSNTGICFYDGTPDIVIEWQHDPAVCVPPESRVALVRYYQAEVALPFGLGISGYEIPPVRCIDKGEHVEGRFTLGPSVTRIEQGPTGEGIPVQIDLPPQIQIQMTVGYNLEPPRISTQDMRPQAAFLAWQRALDSNILRIRRTICWTVSK